GTRARAQGAVHGEARGGTGRHGMGTRTRSRTLTHHNAPELQSFSAPELQSFRASSPALARAGFAIFRFPLDGLCPAFCRKGASGEAFPDHEAEADGEQRG